MPFICSKHREKSKDEKHIRLTDYQTKCSLEGCDLLVNAFVKTGKNLKLEDLHEIDGEFYEFADGDKAIILFSSQNLTKHATSYLKTAQDPSCRGLREYLRSKNIDFIPLNPEYTLLTKGETL